MTRYANRFALAAAVLSVCNAVDSPPTKSPTKKPTATPTKSPTKKPTATPTHAPTAYLGTEKWYASTSPNFCLMDCPTSIGGECSGVNHNTATWQESYADAATCCAQKFSYLDKDWCADRSKKTPLGTEKYYADTSTNSCKKDDTGAKEPLRGSGTLFEDAAKCCTGALGWINSQFCQSRSTGGSGKTDKWYVDYSAMVCRKDCPTGAGCKLTTDGSASNTLFDNVAQCCQGKLGWIPQATCEAVSNGGTATSVATNKYYADYKSSPARCAKDCTTTTSDPTCGGGLSNVAGVQLFDDPATCCAAKFSWMDKDRCASLTFGVPTKKWYVDYQSNSCKQDCPVVANSPCGGSPPDLSMQLFENADTCCAQKLGWVQKDTCTAKSTGASTTATGTLEWYASYDAGTCKLDCPVDTKSPQCGGVRANTAGEQSFKDATSCCAAKFGWVDKDLCVKMGTGGYTNKFYVDYSSNSCKQDCAAGTANCGGNPSDKSIQMFSTASACCAAKLSYINKGTCEAKSTGGSAAVVSGSNKWYIDWSISKCVQDCTSGASCGGLAESWENPEYTSWESCCSSRLSWMKKQDCHK